MSYRRTNEPGGLEIEPSTAGTTGAGDLGVLANLGELSAWLQQDELARAQFAAWYNATADRLGIPKSITSEDVLGTAIDMFYFASNTIARVRRS